MEISNTSAVAPTPIHSVLLCELCDKPFTKELQYKRHIAYCRKSQGRKRLRSCRACNQSKIKCNACEPCHQCVRKGKECMFEPPSKKSLGTTVVTTVPDDGPAPATSTPANPVLEPQLEAESMNGDIGTGFLGQVHEADGQGLAASPQMSRSTSSHDFASSLSWGYQSDRDSFTTTTIAELTTPAEEDDFMRLFNDTFNSSGTKSLVADTNFQMDDVSHNYLQLPPYPPIVPPNTTVVTTTRSPSSSEIVRSGHFTKTCIQTSIQQTCATMIINMMCVYPRMMTRRETFPPFIHAYSPAGDTEEKQNKLPEHLTNCMGIAQLFAARSDDTHSFVWTTIRTEMRGFMVRLHGFNQYDALSALQASLLYLIIRAVDDKPQETKDDYEMLLIYDDVCQCAMQLASGSCHADFNGPNMRWKDWIFLESIRRIACVWYILGLVYHTQSGKPCFLSDHYREILLPCTKSEWEAKTESQWGKEHNIAESNRTTALHTFGDLIDAHGRLPGSKVSEGLDIWNAGIDHLGGVLNLAVHMV